jgi:hypothetical protein
MRSRAIAAVAASAGAVVAVGMGMASAPAATRCSGSGKARHCKKAAPRRARPNSFDGTCRLSGELRFAEPIGSELRTTTFTDTAAGTCSGTLNGVSRDAIPVVNDVTGSATLSCAGGYASSADTLTFARRYSIRIFTDSAGGATQVVAHSRGAVSGDAVVEVNLLPYFDQATLAACQAGTLHSARYDLVARTTTPLVG